MSIISHLKEESRKSQAGKSSIPAKYSRPLKAYQWSMGRFKISSPAIVLDMMCGGGSTVKDIDKIDGITSLGVDIQYYDSHDPERFIISPAEDLNMIPSKSIDLILNYIGFKDYCTDWKQAFSESLRVLKKGGTLITYPSYPEYLNFLDHENVMYSEKTALRPRLKCTWHSFKYNRDYKPSQALYVIKK